MPPMATEQESGLAFTLENRLAALGGQMGPFKDPARGEEGLEHVTAAGISIREIVPDTVRVADLTSGGDEPDGAVLHGVTERRVSDDAVAFQAPLPDGQGFRFLGITGAGRIVYERHPIQSGGADRTAIAPAGVSAQVAVPERGRVATRDGGVVVAAGTEASGEAATGQKEWVIPPKGKLREWNVALSGDYRPVVNTDGGETKVTMKVGLRGDDGVQWLDCFGAKKWPTGNDERVAQVGPKGPGGKALTPAEAIAQQVRTGAIKGPGRVTILGYLNEPQQRGTHTQNPYFVAVEMRMIPAATAQAGRPERRSAGRPAGK